MVLKDYGLIKSTSEKSNCNDMPPLEDGSDLEFAEKALVVTTSLSVQVKEDDVEQQRENIFHIRCLVNNKVCSIINDNNICTNVASIIMVKKLNLNTIKHKNLISSND